VSPLVISYSPTVITPRYPKVSRRYSIIRRYKCRDSSSLHRDSLRTHALYILQRNIEAHCAGLEPANPEALGARLYPYIGLRLGMLQYYVVLLKNIYYTSIIVADELIVNQLSILSINSSKVIELFSLLL